MKKFFDWVHRHFWFIFASEITLLWFAVFCYMSELNPLGMMDGRVDAFYNLTLNEKGDFLAGLFAPVAFFWLIMGYIQQGNEMKEMVKASNEQAKSIQANTNHAALQTFLMLEKSLVEGLKWSLKKFLMSFYYTEWTKKLVQEKNDLFLIIDASRILVSITTDEEREFLQNNRITITDRHKNFYYTYRNNEIVSQAIKSYFSTFEILLAESKKIDTLLNEYYYNIFIDDKADELSNVILRKMVYPPDKAKKHYNFEEFHKNSPAGELYDLFKQIIAEVEKHNAAQAVQENNPS
jgi:hypothetical protein